MEMEDVLAKMYHRPRRRYLTNHPNAAVARWAAALQEEASDLLQEGRMLAGRRFDLPPDWEFDLCAAMRNHAEGKIPNRQFARGLKARRKLLPKG